MIAQFLPEGQHLVCITKAEVKDNKKGGGQHMTVTLTCLSGDYQGARHVDRYTVLSRNSRAIDMGTTRKAAYIIATCGQVTEHNVRDIAGAMFKPFVVALTPHATIAGMTQAEKILSLPSDWPEVFRFAAEDECARLEALLPTKPALGPDAGAPNVIGWGEFAGQVQRPHYVWQHVLQTGYLYALTAFWGAGKTAITIPLALHVAAGREFAGHETDPCKVLYLCGENPADVAMRAKKAAEVYGIADSELVGNIHFTRRPFAIDNPQALAEFVAEASLALKEGERFGLVIVDTGPAHSEAQDEDDNRQAKELALALRELMTLLGNPSLLVLMHPAKTFYKDRPDRIEPRGGGAFSGSVDGLLCAWQDLGVTELYRHPEKFRGPGFEPMCFKMEAHTVEGLSDNFGGDAKTVVAIPLDSDEQAMAKVKGKPLTGGNLVAHDALMELQAQAESVPAQHDWLLGLPECAFFAPAIVIHKDKWRDRCIAKGISAGNAEAQRKAFDRAYKHLLKTNKVRTAGGELHWAYEWMRPKKELLQPAAGMLV